MDIFTPLEQSDFYALDEDLNLSYALTDEQRELFSPASFRAIRDVIGEWINEPGSFSVDLDPESESLNLMIEGIARSDGCVMFSAPITSIISNAISEGDRQSQMVVLLRKLADEIEQGAK